MAIVAAEVTLPDDCLAGVGEGLPNLRCMGPWEYAGGHYFKFRNGNYWLKGGIDDPEAFLGKAFGDWNGKKRAIDYLVSQGVNSIYFVTNNIDGDGQDTWPCGRHATRSQAKQQPLRCRGCRSGRISLIMPRRGHRAAFRLDG
jgi:hypothetical protein